MDEIVSVRRAAGSQQLAIEAPRPSDTPRILELTSNLHLDESAWRSLLAARSVVCAKDLKGELAGLYVANHYSLEYAAERLNDLRGALNVLVNRFKFADTSLAFGAQVVIAPAWQNTDVRGYLLRALLRSVGLRHRHLFCFCRKENPLELHALQNEGWRCFQEEDEVCYFTLDVARALRGLASKLVLQVALNKPLPGRVPVQADSQTA